MSDENDTQGSGTNLFGIKPLAKSVEIATQGAVDMATALIERICFPAAKEIGLVLKDKVHAYRTKQLISVVQKADEKMKANGVTTEMHASPRIVNPILENSSWIDDTVVQDLWAGLLASSCTDQGDDDSNLMFINILSNLTKLQSRILKEACERSQKISHMDGLIHAHWLRMPVDQLKELVGETDMQRLDRELDHLFGLSLLKGSLQPGGSVNLTPTPLALHMYVRCQGSRKSPVEFFEIPATQS